jgi:hypothetical protein
VAGKIPVPTMAAAPGRADPSPGPRPAHHRTACSPTRVPQSGDQATHATPARRAHHPRPPPRSAWRQTTSPRQDRSSSAYGLRALRLDPASRCPLTRKQRRTGRKTDTNQQVTHRLDEAVPHQWAVLRMTDPATQGRAPGGGAGGPPAPRSGLMSGAVKGWGRSRSAGARVPGVAARPRPVPHRAPWRAS